MTSAALGLRAMRGGAVLVAVAVEEGAPHILRSLFLATAGEGDRLSFEPYHVAAELAASGDAAEAARAVAEGRMRQTALAVAGLERLMRGLREDGADPSVAALLVNRAGWVTDLLAYSLASPEHPPVAEGLAVRGALRAAVDRTGLTLVEMDEKMLPPHAADRFGFAPAELEPRLKALGASAGRPWRKEQKNACLAAWLAAMGAR